MNDRLFVLQPNGWITSIHIRCKIIQISHKIS